MLRQQFCSIEPQFGSQINKSNPYSVGLKSLWLMNVGLGGEIFDSSGNDHRLDLYNNPLWGDSLKFSKLAFNASLSTYAYKNVPIGISGSNDRTTILWLRSTYTSGSQPLCSGTFSTGKMWGIRVAQIGADQIVQQAVLNGYRRWYFQNHLDGNWHQVVTRLRGGNNTNDLEAFGDGVQLSVYGTLSQTINTGDGNYTLGRSIDGSQSYTGDIALAAYYDRALSNDEIMELYINPFLMFNNIYNVYPSISISIPVIMYHLKQQGIS